MPDFTTEYNKIKKELDSAKKPLIFFDDDPDGLSSFLLFFRYMQRGRGVIVKSTPKLTAEDARKADEFGADKVFALDLPSVEQSFIDALNVPCVYIDHHTPLKLKNVYYFNPRATDAGLYFPVSLIAYNVVKQDSWIGAAGVAGDFKLPPFLKLFKEEYPGYVGNQNTPEALLFETKLGKLVQVFSMILKGPTSRVMQCVKVLTRIEHPDEIMEQRTPQGKFVYKYAQKYIRVYDGLLAEALKTCVKRGRLLVFTYPGSKLSLTADLAMELIHRFHDKIVIVAREKSGEMKLSIRSRGVNVRDALAKAMVGIEGYGGGHEQACGASVAKKDFERFLKQLENSL